VTKTIPSVRPAEVRAIVWELWKRNRTGIAASLVALPLFSVAYRLLFPGGASGPKLLISFYPFGIALLHAAWVFTYSENDPKSGTAGFPARTFLLPVRTGVLVGIPFLGGAVGITAVYFAWALAVFRPIGVDLPLGWLPLLVATGLACFQTIGWTLGPFPSLRLLAYCVVVVGLQGAGVLASGLLPTGFPARPILFVAAPMVMLGAYLLALLGVSRNRCGEWPPDSGWIAARRRIAGETANRTASPPRPHPSPERAQLWYEWKQYGLLMPFYTGILLAVLLLSAADMRGDELWPFLLVLVGLPAFVGSFVGPVHARSSFWSRDLEIPPFLATRPLSDAALANAKLGILAVGVLLSWLLVLAFGPLAVLRTGQGGRVVGLWQALEAMLGRSTVQGGGGMLAIALLAIPWILAASSLSLALTGRKEWLGRAVIAGFVATVALLAIGWWLFRHPETIPELRSWVPAIEWGGATLAVAVATTLFVAAARRGFLTPGSVRSAALAGVALAAVTAVLAGMGGSAVRGHALPFGLATTALVLAPLAAAPLALSKNRHG
jgi:hypothetical protein